MRITIKATELSRRTDGFMGEDEAWAQGANHWQIDLFAHDTRPDGPREYSFQYSRGSAHEDDPTAREVLLNVLVDVGTVESSTDFEDFALDLGYDSDSRKAEAIYRECLKVVEDMKVFLGEAEFTKAMDLGDEEYCRLLFDGEGFVPRHENEWSTPWIETEIEDVRHRICVVYGIDMGFAVEHTQEPRIAVETKVEKFNENHGVWVEGYVPDPAAYLSEELRDLTQLHLCGLVTGPMYYKANSLFHYRKAIGLDKIGKYDAMKTRSEALAAFKRCCRYGLIKPEADFPSFEGDGLVPLALEEVAENMGVWLEQRYEHVIHSTYALLREWGVPDLDEMIQRGEDLCLANEDLAKAAEKVRKPKLVHTVRKEDVGKWRTKSPGCQHCSEAQTKVLRFPVRIQEDDVGKRIFQVWAEDGSSHSVLQIENDSQLARRIKARGVRDA